MLSLKSSVIQVSAPVKKQEKKAEKDSTKEVSRGQFP
jgi:hypothetical protein